MWCTPSLTASEFCGGEIPEDNPRKITKTIAPHSVSALRVGDIHQPLHVGAEYFNEEGKVVDPDRGAHRFGR